MAYDSKTFGQSPFGAAKPDVSNAVSDKSDAAKTPPASNGLGKGPEAFAKEAAQTSQVDSATATAPQLKEPELEKPQLKSRLKDRFPDLSSITGQITSNKAEAKPNAPKSTTTRKSRASKSTPKSTARKSKKSKLASKSAKATEIEAIEAAEAEVARRFKAENRNAYFSLIYKTGISGLIWAVLRLLRHELPKDVFAVINIFIHPLVIAAITLLAAVGITFWLRYLLNDLAIHTQQLHADAETPDGKNYRPTLEIVGDSLEYNPKLRKNFAALFNAASILICSLASYLMIFAAFPE